MKSVHSHTAGLHRLLYLAKLLFFYVDFVQGIIGVKRFRTIFLFFYFVLSNFFERRVADEASFAFSLLNG